MAAMFTRRAAQAAQFLVTQCRQIQATQRRNFWELGKLNHVAVATSDLKKATAMYKDVLHAKVSAPQPLVDHGVTVVFVEFGNTKVELLEPLGKNSPILNFLKKNPDGGIHHICIDVSDMKGAMEEVRKKGVRMLSKGPSIGAHGKPVIFLHPKDMGGVLIELEENFHEAYNVPKK